MSTTPLPVNGELFPCDTEVALAATRAQTFVHRQARGGAMHLDCDLAMSDDWRPHHRDAAAIDPFGFQSFAIWKHKNIPATEIEVSVALLKHETHPADWVDILLRERGESVLARREFNAPTGRLPDVLTRASRDSAACYQRTTALKDANRLIMLQTRAPLAEYPGLAMEMLLIHGSMRLLDPAREPLAEPMRVFGGRSPAFRFAHPASWRIRHDATNVAPGDCVARLDHHHDSITTGRMDIEVAATADDLSPTSLLDRFTARLRTRGVQLPTVALAPRRPTKWCQAQWGFDGGGELRGVPVSTCVAVLEHPIGLALVAVTGPARETFSHAWAWNRRAFDLARESLQMAW